MALLGSRDTRGYTELHYDPANKSVGSRFFDPQSTLYDGRAADSQDLATRQVLWQLWVLATLQRLMCSRMLGGLYLSTSWFFVGNYGV